MFFRMASGEALVCRAILRRNNCGDPGSNQGPSDLQSDALPTELSQHPQRVLEFAHAGVLAQLHKLPPAHELGHTD